jgi:hypothetical protein
MLVTELDRSAGLVHRTGKRRGKSRNGHRRIGWKPQADFLVRLDSAWWRAKRNPARELLLPSEGALAISQACYLNAPGIQSERFFTLPTASDKVRCS